jgi:predicted metal-dependent hydrolase
MTKFNPLVPDMIYPNKQNPIPEPLTIRKPILLIPDNLPKHWLHGSIFKTQLANGLSIIFQQEEDYFIRIVRKFIPSINNVKVKKGLIAFIGQENQHIAFHQQLSNQLKNQGFQFDSFSNFLKSFVYGGLETFFSNEMNLAIASALEHFNTTIAEISLKDKIFVQSDQTIRELFEWQLAEELEHSNIVYDLLERTDDTYDIRIKGFLIAGLVRGFTLSSTSLLLIVQDDIDQFQRIIKEGVEFLFTKEMIAYKVFTKMIDYWKLDFNPSILFEQELINSILQNRNYEIILNKKSANQSEQKVL